MELEVTPDPPPDERAALARALAEVLVVPGDPDRSAWWREGVRENLEEPPRR